MGMVSVKIGGPSRKGEKRTNRRKGDTQNKYSGPRKAESTQLKEKRVAENAVLSKEGPYKCGQYRRTKPDADFPQHAAASGKLVWVSRAMSRWQERKETCLRSSSVLER